MHSCQGPSDRSILGRSKADPMIHLVHKETDSFWMNEIVLFLCSKAYNLAVNFSGDFYIFTWKENSTTILVQSLVGSFFFFLMMIAMIIIIVVTTEILNLWQKNLSS